MSDATIDLTPPDAREHARSICDEVWGATGLGANTASSDRLHVELLVEDMLDDFVENMVDEAAGKAEEKAQELAEEESERAEQRAADILDELLTELPKRSEATKLVKARAAELRAESEAA